MIVGIWVIIFLYNSKAMIVFNFIDVDTNYYFAVVN